MTDIQKTDSVLFEGYTIYKDGRIISKKGRSIRAYNLTHEGSHVKLRINGKTVVKNKAALIYYCFAGEQVDTYKFFIQFKNGDETDASFDNIYLMDKKDYFNHISHSGISKFSDEEKKTIIREYNRRIKTNKPVSVRSFAIKYKCSYRTMKKVLFPLVDTPHG